MFNTRTILIFAAGIAFAMYVLPFLLGAFGHGRKKATAPVA